MGLALSLAERFSTVVGLPRLSCLASSAVVRPDSACHVASTTYGGVTISVGLQSFTICLAIRFHEDLWTFAHASKSNPARSALCLPIFIDESKSRKLGLRGIGTCLPPDSGPWWHRCRAVDGTGVLETKLHPYLLNSGDLGVLTEYTWNQSHVTWVPMGRRACPHCYIEGWHIDLSFHQHPHSFNLLYGEYFKSRQRRYCSTRVIWVSEPNEMDSSHLSILSTERVLSDEFWMHQVVFPFPRRTKVL